MSRPTSWIALLLALLTAPPADACGPDFPVELLAERGRTLLELPEGVFLDEVTLLVPAPAPYRVVLEDPPAARSGGGVAERALYDEGAAAFTRGDLARAERAFARLLALPVAERRHRSTWAAYMLGRIRGDVAAYRQVRALADAGLVDELGLAASSLGQEARLHLEAGDVPTAVRLYAQQAALGHADGGLSLLFVLRQLVTEGRERELLGDRIGQRLLAIYVRTRGAELAPEVATRLIAALGAIEDVAGADQLAAAAYRAGEWERAARLVARAEDTVTSRWVRAKLALRDGDRAAADRWLATLEPALPSDRADHARVCGERALVAVVDGRYPDALAHAWDARGHHPDAIYLAERVVTTDELSRFVAALPAAEPARAWGLPTPELMRDLLGRRLMREARYAEAFPYLEARTSAVLYASALARAAETPDPIEQARALYEASLVARRDGLAILGTSHAPDWGIYEGEYDPSFGEAPLGVERWLGPGEARRVAASAPPFPDRFHYRQLASHLAESAADRLPHQSQAFAAALCVSARQIFHRDPARAHQLWQRYVDEGAYVAEVGNFGLDCPEPAFDAARRYLPRPAARWPWLLLAGLALGPLWWWRRAVNPLV